MPNLSALAGAALARLVHTIVLSAVCSPLWAQCEMPERDVVDVPAVAASGLCVHNLFQSNMVLQRDVAIRVWGFGTPGDGVSVSLGPDREGESAEVMATTVAADKSWAVTLAARPASSEPLRIVVAGEGQELVLDNILVGDVWVLGGQSNMEFPLERVDSGWLEIVSARFEELRVLTVPAPDGPDTRRGFARLHEWSDWFGRHFRKGDWDVCRPEIAQDLSAIGYVFARRLHMATGIPIGVIDVSRGGTTVETWTPEPVLRSLATPDVAALLADWDARVAEWNPEEDLAERVRNFERRVQAKKKKGEPIPEDWALPTELERGPAWDPNRPGNCFRNMIAPLAGLSARGVLFHQGYNNAIGGVSGGSEMYREIFGAMIEAWRDAFGQPQMPFGIISLCTDGPRQTRDNYAEMMLNDGVYIRAAQYQTFLELRRAGDNNLGFASSFDMRRGWYHPQLKIPVGERISKWALATQYGMGKRIRWEPPVYERMEVLEGSIVLHMDRAVSAADTSAVIEGFAIAGVDRQFHPADATWRVIEPESGSNGRGRPREDRRTLVLRSPHVESPIHFRYAWGRNPMGNLQSADHNELPFATQRSDGWEAGEVPLGVLGDGVAVRDGKLTRRQRARILKVLRAADLDRRLADARALLEAHDAEGDAKRHR